MDDLVNAIRPFVLTLSIIVTYVIVVQLTNDPGCAALEANDGRLFGQGFIKFISLCWW